MGDGALRMLGMGSGVRPWGAKMVTVLLENQFGERYWPYYLSMLLYFWRNWL
jgi:hypothetical protein